MSRDRYGNSSQIITMEVLKGPVVFPGASGVSSRRGNKMATDIISVHEDNLSWMRETMGNANIPASDNL